MEAARRMLYRRVPAGASPKPGASFSGEEITMGSPIAGSAAEGSSRGADGEENEEEVIIDVLSLILSYFAMVGFCDFAMIAVSHPARDGAMVRCDSAIIAESQCW